MTSKKTEIKKILSKLIMISAFLLIPIITAYYFLQGNSGHQKVFSDIQVDEYSWVQNVLETRYQVAYPKSAITAHSIVSASYKEGIPLEVLMAMIKVESDYRGSAVGKHGEIGFMQLKEKYWKDECKRYSIRDKYENIFAGACALRWNMDRTRTIDDALVAYNIGMTDFDNRKDLFRGFKYRDKVKVEYAELIDLKTLPVDTE